MGIDARMFVRVPRAVSDNDLRDWNYRLGSMAHHWLFLGSGDRIYHKPLERIAIYKQDGDDIVPKDGETFLNVPLGGRYYSDGYERGDLLAYVGIAEFLEVLIPDCAVWYGGDSSGVCAELFDRSARTKLLAHASKVSHDPYNSHFDSRRDVPQPMCQSCEFPMDRRGFGNNYALFTCNGCDWEIQIRDGQKIEGFNVAEIERLKREKTPA